MDAILLCGGRGTRLDSAAEKPLHAVAGRPMLDRVRAALRRAEAVSTVHLVTSPNAPRTARYAAETAGPQETVLGAAGEGYVADLGRALGDARVTTPALTAVADLPLLAADAVDAVCAHYGALDPDPTPTPSLTVCVPTALKDALGVSADTTRAHGGRELAPTGLNVVGTATDGDAGDDVDDGGDDVDGGGDGAVGNDGRGAADGTADGAGTAPDYDERLYVTHDARLAVNVNRLADAAVAAGLAADGGGR